MAKPWAKPFYNSARWKSCRAAYISKRMATDGGMCEACRTEPGYIVDHIEELTPANINDPHVSLNHDNMQYLCHNCHNAKTFGDARYILTPEGDVLPLPPSKFPAVF